MVSVSDMVRRKLFLLEDHADLRIVVASVLSKMGFEVVQSDRPDVALARLKTEKFDLLVTDLRMEGMSGAELLCALEKTGIKDIGVLVMSAGELSELKSEDQKIIRKYRTVFLRKPFTSQELTRAILQLTQQ